MLCLIGIIFGLQVLNFDLTLGAVEKNNAHLLHEFLMVNQSYNRKIRPTANLSVPTVVTLNLSLMNILEYNEVAEELSLTAKLRVSWVDDYLSWDTSMFDGIQQINIPQNDIWKPDLTLENSVSSYTDFGTPGMFVLVESDGRVLWKPMQVFRASCPADITRFPMDSQTCCLKFEIWSHTTGQLKIQNGKDTVTLHGYTGQTQWYITDTKAETIIVDNDIYVYFCLHLARKSLFDMLNIVLPISMLSILNCCVFLLPSASGEKASFSVTVFLSLVVFLTIVSQQLPQASDRVALFNLYLFCQVIASTLITIITILQLKLYHKVDGKEVPAWLRRLIVRPVSASNKVDTFEDEGKQKLEQTMEQKATCKDAREVTWAFVSEYLDTIFFVMFLSLNVVLVLVLIMMSISGAPSGKI